MIGCLGERLLTNGLRAPIDLFGSHLWPGHPASGQSTVVSPSPLVDVREIDVAEQLSSKCELVRVCN